MAIVLDTVTKASYDALTTASSRAAAVVAALTGTVVVEVYDGLDGLRATGTMATPWATASGSTITVGEVTAAGMTVSSGGAPDDYWYCQFRSGTKFVRGTFGVLGSGKDFVWSLSSFQTGSKGTLGTVTLVSPGSVAPSVVVSPTISGTAQVGSVLTSTLGTWDGQAPITYARQWYRSNGSVDTLITGETAATYTLATADVAQSVRVVVTATNSVSSVQAASAFLGPVTASGTNHLSRTTDPIITVWNRTDNPNPAGTTPTLVGQQLQVYPAGWDRSLLTSTASEEFYKTVIRQFWERRNNSSAAWEAITDVAGNAYQGGPYVPTEVGEVSVRETVTDINGTSSARSAIFTIGSAALDTELVYANDMTYLGSFRGPQGGNNYDFTKYGAQAMSFDAAGNGGAGSLFMTSRYGITSGGDLKYEFGEITIPTLVNASSIGSINSASFTSRNPAPVEATEGQLFNSGIPGNLWRYHTGSLVYNSKLIMAANVGYASRTPATHWRRPLTLATTGQIEGPVALSDGVTGTPRERGGRMCHVPAAWQSALGGPALVGSVNYSLNQTMSHGPSAFSFDPDAISGKTFLSGTCPSQTGMSSTQIKLAASTTGALAGRYLGLTGGTAYAADNSIGVKRITAWNDTTKVATIDTAWEFGNPDTTTTYKVFETIADSVLAFYPSGVSTSLEYTDARVGQIFSFAPAVWGDATFLAGMCIPHGTRTLLHVTVGGNGFLRYNNTQAQYDPQRPITGPRAYPYLYRFYAYDLNHLAEVKADARLPYNVRPYATWNFDLKVAPTGGDLGGLCYDPVNRRIYISQWGGGPNGEAIIHALQVNNAVAI